MGECVLGPPFHQIARAGKPSSMEKHICEDCSHIHFRKILYREMLPHEGVLRSLWAWLIPKQYTLCLWYPQTILHRTFCHFNLNRFEYDPAGAIQYLEQDCNHTAQVIFYKMPDFFDANLENSGWITKGFYKKPSEPKHHLSSWLLNAKLLYGIGT